MERLKGGGGGGTLGGLGGGSWGAGGGGVMKKKKLSQPPNKTKTKPQTQHPITNNNKQNKPKNIAGRTTPSPESMRDGAEWRFYCAGPASLRSFRIRMRGDSLGPISFAGGSSKDGGLTLCWIRRKWCGRPPGTFRTRPEGGTRDFYFLIGEVAKRGPRARREVHNCERAKSPGKGPKTWRDRDGPTMLRQLWK